MIVNIVSGSPNLDLKILNHYKADMTIGVDYGALRLIENNYKLDAALGDFDSISTAQFVQVLNSCDAVLKYESNKNETDTELALNYALTFEPDEINLFGVTGKRLDHFLGVLNLYQKVMTKNIKLTIIDKNNHIYLLKPGVHTIKKSHLHYISFFSYQGAVEELTIHGFKYELTAFHLTNENSLCISNEIMEGYGTVQFTNGFLLIVESND